MEEILKQHRELLARVDRWFAHCIALYPEQISCRSGCSSCCRGLFDVTLLDACYLKMGFDLLRPEKKEPVLRRCRERLRLMREQWPELDYPFFLNHRPEEQWEDLMPEDDETPCVLLGEDGRCLVYDYRPMTCRLNGIPFVDTSGEVMHEEWCTMNFLDEDPLQLHGLRAPFEEMFRLEVELFRQFTYRIFNKRISELDTFIPTALLIDFDNFDWNSFIGSFRPAQ